MALSVALPSFDAFLRSARRAPAVLPHAPPTTQYRPLHIHTPTDDRYDERYGYESPMATAPRAYASSSSMTPPGSPYYGHFVSLSPVASPVSESAATPESWRYSDDESYYETSRAAATRYQDLLSQHCVAIAPRPRNAPSTHAMSSDGKPMRTKKKYLKERQRCEIVRRVRAGEKQAHLAKEFGVSRAAVCYLLKHEYDILRRSALRQQRRKHLR